MKYSKSFRYDSDEWPQVHKWIENLEKEGKDFSEAVRRLIAGQPSDVLTEIEIIKKQLAALAEKGVRIEPIYEAPENINEPPPAEEPSRDEPGTTVKVNVGFLKQRYF